MVHMGRLNINALTWTVLISGDGLKMARKLTLIVNEGTKDDEGKIPLDLWSPLALEETAKVLAFGAAKYGPYNWAKGIKYSRVFSALLRHLWAFWRREKLDPETGLHHLAHAMCCLMFLLHYEMNRRKYNSFDDRLS
jgi:hypothetical protein